MSGRTIIAYRRSSYRWICLELTRPGEAVHEAIERLRAEHDDLVAVRPLLELPRARRRRERTR